MWPQMEQTNPFNKIGTHQKSLHYKKLQKKEIVHLCLWKKKYK